jgi:hypothetical protein
MSNALISGAGSECNKVKIGGTTTLYGDPNKKPEKPHTIVIFPGGSVEITRTETNDYWVHVATKQATPDQPLANITSARIDAADRYCEGANDAIKSEIEEGKVNHIAFLISTQR